MVFSSRSKTILKNLLLDFSLPLIQLDIPRVLTSPARDNCQINSSLLKETISLWKLEFTVCGAYLLLLCMKRLKNRKLIPAFNLAISGVIINFTLPGLIDFVDGDCDATHRFCYCGSFLLIPCSPALPASDNGSRAKKLAESCQSDDIITLKTLFLQQNDRSLHL